MKTDMLPRVTPQFVALGTFFFSDDESEMHILLINSCAKRECTTGGRRYLRQFWKLEECQLTDDVAEGCTLLLPTLHLS